MPRWPRCTSAPAKLGLSLAVVHQNTTAVWPPTGIAIAALILWGFRLCPGVLIGALAVNWATNFDVMSAFGIAIGNTLEATAGAWLVIHFAGGRRVVESAANIFKFVVLVSLLSTTISATVGVMTLFLTGSANWLTFWPIWLTWWLGDTAGALTVMPLILVWIGQPLPRLQKREALEAVCLLAVTILSAVAIFSRLSPLAVSNYPLAFLTIPVLMWASYRFGQRGTTLAILILGSAAVLGAAKGIGPFYSVHDPNQSLLLLQAFFRNRDGRHACAGCGGESAEARRRGTASKRGRFSAHGELHSASRLDGERRRDHHIRQ
jgi:integral membrane sensor domain MASE1